MILLRINPETQLLDELLEEVQEVFAISILSIAKQLHRDTGLMSGEFPCPKCHSGVIVWAVPRVGLTSILCSTTYHDDDGIPFRCMSAIE